MNINQVGRFRISDKLVRERLEEVSDVFAMLHLVVLRVEHLFYPGAFEYEAIGDCFDRIDDGQAIPYYTLTYVEDEKGRIRNIEVERERP